VRNLVLWLRAQPLSRVVAGGVVALYLMASIYVVKSSEVAVVLRFGAPVGTPLSPGLHARPWGIERVVRFEVTRTYTVPVGSPELDDIRAQPGLSRSAIGEADAPRPEPGGEEAPGSWVTGDTNVLSMLLVAQYQIVDPVRHLRSGLGPAGLVRRAVEAALTDVAGRMPVDDLLTRGRLIATDQTRQGAQKRLDAYGSGLQVVSLALRSIEPPAPVLAAFQDVQDARSDRERLINEARGVANETLPTARGEAGTQLSAAAALAGERVEKALGDTRRFGDVRRAAAFAPSLMRERLYLEAMEKALPRMKLLVIEGGGGRLRLVEPSGGVRP
jgi:membrane protease subunit HflK